MEKCDIDKLENSNSNLSHGSEYHFRWAVLRTLMAIAYLLLDIKTEIREK